MANINGNSAVLEKMDENFDFISQAAAASGVSIEGFSGFLASMSTEDAAGVLVRHSKAIQIPMEHSFLLDLSDLASSSPVLFHAVPAVPFTKNTQNSPMLNQLRRVLPGPGFTHIFRLWLGLTHIPHVANRISVLRSSQSQSHVIFCRSLCQKPSVPFSLRMRWACMNARPMKLGLGNALFDSVLSDCRHFFNRLLINHYM